MKNKTLLALGLALVSAVSAIGQGSIDFSYITGSGLRVAAPSVPASHQAGWYLGSDYSVGFWIASGTVTDPNALTFVPGSLTSMGFGAGTTAAGGPANDGNGLFSHGTAVITPIAPGTASTIQVRAWYNGGQFATYDLAVAAGRNIGGSPLFSIAPADPTSPVQPSMDSAGMAAFSASVIPEPSTMALAGLGAAALLIFRRRK